MEITTEQRMTEAKKIIERVESFSRDFVGEDMPVNINWNKVDDLGSQMLKSEKLNYKSYDDLGTAHTILLELYANSINYCFWYI